MSSNTLTIRMRDGRSARVADAALAEMVRDALAPHIEKLCEQVDRFVTHRRQEIRDAAEPVRLLHDGERFVEIGRFTKRDAAFARDAIDARQDEQRAKLAEMNENARKHYGRIH